MPTSNGIITSPINISDVSTTLGVASLDIGTLCTASSINKWAKYKPVNHSSPIANLVDPSWWKSDDGNCGLIPSVTGPLDSVINGSWSYNKPTGNIFISPYRLLDFDGYNHYAKSPIEHGYKDGIDVDKLKDKEIRIMFAIPYDDVYRFSPADMESLKNTYISAYLTNGVHRLKVSTPSFVSDRTNEDNATTITIPVSELYAGEYTCHLVFSTAKIIIGQPEPSTNFYPFLNDINMPSNFKIRVKQESPVEINFLTLSYATFGTYITIQEAGDIFPNDMIWVMYTNGDIAVEISIYNKSDGPISILRDQLRISTRTVYDTDIVRSGTMFDGSINTQGITIYKGQTKKVKMLYDDIILYNGSVVQIPSAETKMKILSATILYYSQDGSSWAAAGGSATYNVKYSPSRREWIKETIYQ